jgi:DNA-binding NtrC family response regulator
MKYSVLVVDDEKHIREGLGRVLEMDGYRALLAADGREALEILERGEADLVITDLKMPHLSGEELLKRSAAIFPNLPVIILTGHGTIENAVQAMRDGAYDYLTKPVNLDRLALLVKRALSNRELIIRHRALQDELEKKNRFANIIGKSEVMKRLFEMIQQVAPTKASVLITGESGTGKEMIADALHYNSPRKDRPLIKVHCAALTETLLESELFGHEKGAFTGAVARKRGRFELAHLGTVFLDEIGEISPNVQIKLLRVLEEKSFERVGGEEPVEVDVRIIAATNKNLKEEIRHGRFREDLYYRLNVVHLHIPPLRERKEDTPLLIAAFLKEFARENGKTIEGIESKASNALYNYSWPGNVRELRNCIESAVVMCKGNVLALEDLPPYIHTDTGGNYIKLAAGISLAEGEMRIIQSTLNQYQGNKSKTAEVLGIGRKTLHRKIQEYGLGE